MITLTDAGTIVAANALPVLAAKQQSAAETVAAIYRRQRITPISELSPTSIARLLDAYMLGNIQGAALLWDKIERRDDKVRPVVWKRKKAVSKLAWEILTDDDSDEAARHKAALEYLYKNITASDITKRDVRGGVPTLIRQILDAIGHGYAVNELVWKPGRDADGNDAYSVEAIKIPLWFFECTEGRLRLLPSPTSIAGKELEKRGWLVAASEDSPLHEATCIAYLFKVAPLRDWAFYCEKFGLPWVHGKTDATPNTPEWDQFAEAVAGMGNDCQLVTNLAAEIEINNVGSTGQAPHPALVDRMDRAIVTLWLGGDLSTMSQKGDSTGSNPQSVSLADIVADDAEFVTEQLRQLDRYCIELLFGEGTEPLAHFSLLIPPNVDSQRRREEIKDAVGMGVPVGQQFYRDTFSIPAPEDDEELLQAPVAQAPDGFHAAANAAANQPDRAEQSDLKTLQTKTLAALAAAEREDWKPLIDRIAELDAEKSPEAFAASLKKLRDELPELIGEIYADSKTADILAGAMENAAELGLQKSPDFAPKNQKTPKGADPTR